MRLVIALCSTFAPFAAMAEEGKGGLLTPNGGLMFWMLVIFLCVMAVLTKFAYKPLLEAVEAREAALEAAITNAQRDREAAAQLLAQQQQQLDTARGEAQRLIADGRATSEKLKASMLEETKAQQQAMLDRARRELDNEKSRAIAELRREAIDLALAGAGKVISRNLDDAANRKLIDDFLASIPKSK